MSLKIIDGTPSSISKFIREKEEMELRKQGAVEELENNISFLEFLSRYDYIDIWLKREITNKLELLNKRLKELKEGV
jgi:hypothetical protein